MNQLNLRELLLGSVALIVVTQIACTVWIGRQNKAPSPADYSSEFADITEKLAGVESAVSDVQGTADGIQARTQALVDSMSSVARACSR
jgi:uncharacterized membrane protein YfbV (UPF0208 family)